MTIQNRIQCQLNSNACQTIAIWSTSQPVSLARPHALAKSGIASKRNEKWQLLWQ